MKAKFMLMVTGILISGIAFGQDTTFTYHYDTRLGSSSPVYNSYPKNDYGAGAITNNAGKTQSFGISHITSPLININAAPAIYRDTRLGSSSPLYNTYKKNDFGAGAVTNNPNKGSSAAPEFIPESRDTLTTGKIKDLL